MPPSTRTSTTHPRSLQTFVALFSLFATAASAQTVIVTHAPAGGPVELVFNSDRVSTTAADANGEATLTFSLPVTLNEADVRVSVDRCGDTRRVLLVERGLQTPPPTGPCDRRDVSGFFIVRRMTTFVIDVQNADPAVHVRQGPAPLSWLGRPGVPEKEGLVLPPAPSGLIAFASAGVAHSSSFSDLACGNADTCSATGLTIGTSVGVGYWISHIIGVQADYFHPNRITALGSGTGYHFSSARTADLFSINAMAGIPVGGLRIYGRGGANYHRATFTTSETIDNSGSQNSELKTAGWGWVGAGGFEVWFKPSIAFYADGGIAKIKGAALGGIEGSMDDELVFVTAGVRLHIGR